MKSSKKRDETKKQADRFAEKARELGTDESEAEFDRMLKKIVPPKGENEKKKTPDK